MVLGGTVSINKILIHIFFLKKGTVSININTWRREAGITTGLESLGKRIISDGRVLIEQVKSVETV